MVKLVMCYAYITSSYLETIMDSKTIYGLRSDSTETPMLQKSFIGAYTLRSVLIPFLSSARP